MNLKTLVYWLLCRFVFPMLSLLRAGCNMHHLEQAIEKAIVEIKSRLCTQETKQISQRCSESQSAAVSKSQEKVFVQKLKEAGFPTVLAIKALKEVGSTDEERGECEMLPNDQTFCYSPHQKNLDHAKIFSSKSASSISLLVSWTQQLKIALTEKLFLFGTRHTLC